MPLSKHTSFPEPPAQTKIWRYMSFIKLFSMIKSSNIYFSSAHQLRKIDKLEGSLTRQEAENIRVEDIVDGRSSETYIVSVNDTTDGMSEEEKAQRIKMFIFKRHIRTLEMYVNYINCWHMNEDESVAMWKLYDPSNEGIAVVSSYERLCESICYERQFYVGKVQYIKHATEPKWLPNLFDPFMHKSVSLQHECELRAIIHEDNDFTTIALSDLLEGREIKKYPPPGLPIKCNLELLIDYIVVSPNAPPWVYELVKNFCGQELGKDVRASEIERSPLF